MLLRIAFDHHKNQSKIIQIKIIIDWAATV